MSASRTINVLVSGNATSLRTTLVAAGRDVKRFSREVAAANATGAKAARTNTQVASSANAAGRAMVYMSRGGLAIAAALGYSAMKATEFDKRMRNVNSIAHMSEEQLAATSRRIVDMSLVLPQTANILAEGLYEITSSGYDGADALFILEQAAIGASAGLSTTEVAAKGIVSVLNAYGLSVADAAHVNNILFTGVDVGILSFEELTSNIGDFVGTAAAAKVPIDDATAAIAAMTLSGINAAESSTSLNRLLQSLIDPSESLAKIFASWGYESGAAALETMGLEQVMDRLRNTTGGNITQLLALFPEIRAARGALALMANEGQNYADTSEAMTKADEGQGAAKRALKEQMKSVSAQWQLFVNWMNATAITVGTKLLPALTAVMDAVREMFGAIGRFLSGEEMTSFFSDVTDAAIGFKDAAVQVFKALQPTGELLLKIAGGAVLMTLQALGKILAFAASMAQRFSGVLMAMVTAFVVFKSVGAAVAAIQMLSAALTGGRAAIIGFNAAMQSLAATRGVSTLAAYGSVGKASLAGLAGGAGIAASALTVFAIAFVGIVSAMANESKKAKKWADEFEKSLKIDKNDLGDNERALSAYTDEIERLQKRAGNKGGMNALKEFAQLASPWNSNDITEARERLEEIDEEQTKYAKRTENLRHNLKMLSDRFGMTQGAVKRLADSQNVDLGKAMLSTHSDLTWVGDGLDKLGKKYGANAQEVKRWATLTAEEMEDALKAEQDFLDDVANGLDSMQNMVAKFGKEGTGPNHLREFYKKALDETNKFTENLSKAIQMGLDPNVVKEIMVAGPEEASGILEDIVADSSGTMVQIVNNAEAALAEANTRLLEMARIAHRATTADSQQMVLDAANATKISMMTMEKDATTSAESIAKALKIPIDEVIRIADDYGIVVDRTNGKIIDPKVDPKSAKEVKASMDEIVGDINAVAANDPRIKLAADIQDPMQKFGLLRDTAMEYVNSNPTTKAYFETLNAEDKMEYMVQVLGDPSLWTAYASVTMNTADWDAGLTGIYTDIFNIVNTDPTATAYLQTHNAEQNVAFLQRLLMEYAGSSPEAQAMVETYAAQLGFETLNGWATLWGGRVDTADANIQTTGAAAAEAEINRVARDRVAKIALQIGATIKERIVPAPSGQSGRDDGNRWGRIHSFRHGGTTTEAHVQDREAIRYAEKETGGEAFIPRRGLRGRSINILSRAAGWYGMSVVPRRNMAKGGVASFESKSERDQRLFSQWMEKAKENYDKVISEVEKQRREWYDKLPQLNKDLVDAQEMLGNSKVKAVKPGATPLFGWEQRMRPHAPFVPPSFVKQQAQFAGRSTGGTIVNVKVMAPVYGVDNLKKAINDGVTEGLGKNYSGVVGTMRRREDAQK